MSDVVVDTDVVSYLIKRDSRAAAYRRHLLGRTLYIPFMTLAELDRWELASNWNTARQARVTQYLASFGLLSVNRPLCRKWAEVVEAGRRSGFPIAVADAWIAATALTLNAPLITHNAADYRGVVGLSIITEAP